MLKILGFWMLRQAVHIFTTVLREVKLPYSVSMLLQTRINWTQAKQ